MTTSQEWAERIGIEEPTTYTPKIVPARRHKLPKGECKYCDGEKTSFHPPHDASIRCESGRRNHCSCDLCF